ncbi:hypothetical protein [Azospirillum brasilense]|nr:hypothetical protein [Azospirillum brasilense]
MNDDLGHITRAIADSTATISGNLAGIARATENAAKSTGKVKALTRTLVT